MPKKENGSSYVKAELAGLSLAERALLRRAVYEHPNAVRVDEADAVLADNLQRLDLLRPAAIGQRYCWRLNDRLVARRSSLREALFPQ
ncbi:hypothetical protein G3545_06130 [Starkeya sp. ORNL1]|uniref:hypothetical protein n=1 Tax=Starkeya sp. ORNL1 TaxID=2709380 RepID=UPI0014633428|nr:hypothetical protein [Starkeya sp. ORNL1]QJP13263.1 hypothetical protein G3545_06130 [Starkeya sp. ORNL1]